MMMHSEPSPAANKSISFSDKQKNGKSFMFGKNKDERVIQNKKVEESKYTLDITDSYFYEKGNTEELPVILE